MQIKISYFYKVRFMKPNMIPLSTAVWNPKWFNDFRGQNHIFKDKNGVYNGLRAEPFVPGPMCAESCNGREVCGCKNPKECSFLQFYRKQLDELNFDEIMQRFERITNFIQEKEGFEEEPIAILLVHEAPNNPCSERWVIKQWFEDNGYPIEEFKEEKENGNI